MNTKITLILLVLTLTSCTNPEVKQIEKTEVKKENTAEVQQIPDGDFIQKHSSGSLKIKGKMLNNKRDGLWTAYYEGGNKQSESTYQNGILHGRTASFYTNGQVRYIGYFLGGKKDGKWVLYTEEGEFDKSEMYKQGILSR